MQTPDFNQPKNPTAIAVRTASTSLPLLAPMVVSPSQSLPYLVLLSYITFVLCICAAFWPYLSLYPLLTVIPLASALWARHLVLKAFKQQWRGSLAYSSHGWVFTTPEGIRHRWMLSGEVLIWPGLVILPFIALGSRRRRYLIIAADSLSSADFSRLRTWLRACLIPKA